MGDVTPTPYILVLGALFILLQVAQLIINRNKIKDKNEEIELKFKNDMADSSKENREQFFKTNEQLRVLQKSVYDGQVELKQKEITDLAMRNKITELMSDLDKANQRIRVLASENSKLKSDIEMLKLLVNPSSEPPLDI